MYLMLFYSSTEKLPIDKALFYFYSFCRSNRSINLNISCSKKFTSDVVQYAHVMDTPLSNDVHTS